MECGNYTVAYIGNLEYVSNGLLSIVNTKILPDKTSGAPYTVEQSGTCITTLTTLPSTVFDCTKWEIIKDLLIDDSETVPDSLLGLLVVLRKTLICILNTTSQINHGFAAQLERFICIVESLETRLDSISCNSNCPELVGDLLCLLMQLITQLISTVAKFSVLAYYMKCDINSVNGNKIIASFFECMVCDFVNDLCELENLIPELSSIVVGFATCDSKVCTPCYTASCAPRKVRPMCPPKNYSHGCNTCSCNKPSNDNNSCGCNNCGCDN